MKGATFGRSTAAIIATAFGFSSGSDGFLVL
jgi:hypothetical protein